MTEKKKLAWLRPTTPLGKSVVLIILGGVFVYAGTLTLNLLNQPSDIDVAFGATALFAEILSAGLIFHSILSTKRETKQ